MGLQCLPTTEVSSARGGGLPSPSSCARRAVLAQLVAAAEHLLSGDAGDGDFLGACVRSGAWVCDIRFPS